MLFLFNENVKILQGFDVPVFQLRHSRSAFLYFVQIKLYSDLSLCRLGMQANFGNMLHFEEHTIIIGLTSAVEFVMRTNLTQVNQHKGLLAKIFSSHKPFG